MADVCIVCFCFLFFSFRFALLCFFLFCDRRPGAAMAERVHRLASAITAHAWNGDGSGKSSGDRRVESGGVECSRTNAIAIAIAIAIECLRSSSTLCSCPLFLLLSYLFCVCVCVCVCSLVQSWPSARTITPFRFSRTLERAFRSSTPSRR